MRYGFVWLVLILMVVCSSLTLANLEWFNYGNVGYSIGNDYVYFGSLLQSNHNVSDKFSCEISTSALFSPVIADFNLDGFNEIVVVNSLDEVRVYDFGCSLLFVQNLGEDIKSMPSVLNWNENEYSEFVVHSVSKITIFEYDSIAGNYSAIKSVDTVGSAEFGLVCSSELPDAICMSINGSRIDSIVYNIDNDLYSVLSDFYLANDKVTNSAPFGGLGIGKFIHTTELDIPVVGVDASSGLRGYILSSNLDEDYNCQIEVPSSTFSQLSQVHVGYAGLGSATSPSNFFMSGKMRQGASKYYYASICDNSATRRVFIKSGSGLDDITNWAVSDFDGINGNDACILYFNSTADSSQFVCVNSGYNVFFNQFYNVTRGYSYLGVADFDNSNSNYMEFVTIDGIIRYNPTNNSFSNIYDITGLLSNQSASIQVVRSDTSNSNNVVYTQGDKVFVIGFSAVNVVSCGDSVCSASESVYTCPVDCLVNSSAPPDLLGSGEGCVNSSECVTGLCLYNYCALKGNGVTCSADYQCLSGDCGTNGKCKKASLWETIDAGKSESFGDDTNTNNLISIVTMSAIGYGFIASGNPFGIVAGFIIIIAFGGFFVAVGWLQFWIFMVMILVAIASGLVMLLLKAGSGGG